MSEQVELLRLMVRGAYDLQALRMQMGLRLCANFRAKLSDQPAEDDGDDEMSEEAKRIVVMLKDSHKRLTDGVARNRTLPAQKGFTGDELISTHAELTLVDQYVRIEMQETSAFRQMEGLLSPIPIYRDYLAGVVGVGPAMAGVIVSTLDPHKAQYVSSFWKYAGIDVGSDGAGRSRRAEHLVDREYTDSNGETAVRKGITYNPWLKTKLVGVLAGSFLRSGSPWRKVYDDYRHRLETDPARSRCTVGEWKKRRAAGEDVSKLWTPGRINNAAKRYMVKMFLADLWANWRRMEGLPVTPTYQEAKLGHMHRAA